MNEDLSRRTFLGLAAGTAGSCLVQGRTRTPPEKQSRSLSFRRDLKVREPHDVVVCGGGPAGFAAALAARRGGLRVLLVEGQGQLGGNGTSGLVSHWLGGRTSDCTRWVVGGLFRLLSEEAAARRIALIPKPDRRKRYQPHGWLRGQLAAGIPFDPFGMAALLDEKLAASGVDVLLMTQAVDLIVAGPRATHVVIFNKSGLATVPAGAVIDATGDADLAARSGCATEKGREPDGLMTPASLIFHVDNVDQKALDEYIHEQNAPRFRKKIEELRKAGIWKFPFEIFISVQLDEPGTLMINTTRLVGIDGTDGSSVTAGLIRGRREIQDLLAILRKHFPGFERVRLKAVAPVLGIRETRRIRGRHVLTVRDLNGGRKFDDTIGFSAYGWDLPDPRRPSDNPGHGRKLPVTPIPYGILVPGKIENLICPGRAVSVERPVLGPLRVMAPCMAMGEAAGEAAGLALRTQTSFGAVDIPALRKQLGDHGAIVDWT